jgi:alkanesulfonate monooxygenase SsuD/methylene tetrahydromethanopterin reductase-like flavin-dependent oxidoreductase (luciferase family)
VSKLEFGLFLDLATDKVSIADHLAVYRPLVALAERYGFGSVWAGESYAAANGGFQHVSSPLLVLAALSGDTSMRLGTGVTLLPMWNTLRLAYDGIVMDQLSGGRFELGVGLGSAKTWSQFGVDTATIGERIDEQLAALRALWSGEDGYHGRFVEIDGAIGPRPLQAGGPRIWVGGKIKRSTRRAAELGDGYIAGTHFGLAMVQRQIEGYRAALGAAGKPPDAGRVAVNRILVLAETHEQAWSESAAYIERLLRKYAMLKMFPGAADLAAAPEGDPGALRRACEGMCLVGTPESVARELEPYIASGIDHVQFRPAPGGMPAEVATRTIELAGQRLLPALLQEEAG